jgi:hypothetical protein
VGGVLAIWAGDSALLEPRHLAHRSRCMPCLASARPRSREGAAENASAPRTPRLPGLRSVAAAVTFLEPPHFVLLARMCPCLPASVRNYHIATAPGSSSRRARHVCTGVCNLCARCRLLNPGRMEVCASRRRDLDVLPCAETERRARLPKCCGSAYRRLPCACLQRSSRYDVVQWI